MNYYVFFCFLVFISDVLVPQTIAAGEVARANNRVRSLLLDHRKCYSTRLKSPTIGHRHTDIWAEEVGIKRNDLKEKGVHISNCVWW